MIDLEQIEESGRKWFPENRLTSDDFGEIYFNATNSLVSFPNGGADFFYDLLYMTDEQLQMHIYPILQSMTGALSTYPNTMQICAWLRGARHWGFEFDDEVSESVCSKRLN